jgi:hypothetical protein
LRRGYDYQVNVYQIHNNTSEVYNIYLKVLYYRSVSLSGVRMRVRLNLSEAHANEWEYVNLKLIPFDPVMMEQE